MSMLGLNMERSTVVTLALMLLGVVGIDVLRRFARKRRHDRESATVSERRERLERLVQRQ